MCVDSLPRARSTSRQRYLSIGCSQSPTEDYDFRPFRKLQTRKKEEKKSVCSVFFYGERKKEQQLPPLPSCHTRRPFGFSQKGQLVQVFHFTVKRAIQAIHERFHSTSLRARILTPPLFSHQEFPFPSFPLRSETLLFQFLSPPQGVAPSYKLWREKSFRGGKGWRPGIVTFLVPPERRGKVVSPSGVCGGESCPATRGVTRGEVLR